jgi:hypothetical protein
VTADITIASHAGHPFVTAKAPKLTASAKAPTASPMPIRRPPRHPALEPFGVPRTSVSLCAAADVSDSARSGAALDWREGSLC